MSKNNARNLAAASALFKLYETQDVIKVCSVQSFYENIFIIGYITLKNILKITLIISLILCR